MIWYHKDELDCRAIRIDKNKDGPRGMSDLHDRLDDFEDDYDRRAP